MSCLDKCRLAGLTELKWRSQGQFGVQLGQRRSRVELRARLGLQWVLQLRMSLGYHEDGSRREFAAEARHDLRIASALRSDGAWG